MYLSSLSDLIGDYFSRNYKRKLLDLKSKLGDRYLFADLHTHSCYSDGLHTPLEMAIEAKERGLDVIAITDHYSSIKGRLRKIFNCLELVSKQLNYPLIPGTEISVTRTLHLLALFSTYDVDLPRDLPNLPLEEIADIVRGKGGVLILTHADSAKICSCGFIDGVEVLNARRYTKVSDVNYPVAKIACSDAHEKYSLGFAFTLLNKHKSENSDCAGLIERIITCIKNMETRGLILNTAAMRVLLSYLTRFTKLSYIKRLVPRILAT